MAYSVDWEAGIITIPQADLVYLSPNTYKLDLYAFMTECWRLSWGGGEGLSYPEIMTYYPVIDTGDVILGKTILINFEYYSIFFEDTVDRYAVKLDGANTNVHNYSAITNGIPYPNNSAGLQNLDTLLSSAYQGRIIIDPIRGQAGTVVPIGTLGTPSSNVTDAVVIAQREGIDTLFFVGSYLLYEDVHNFILKGSNKVLTNLSIFDIANVTNCTIEDCHITGVLDGNNLIRNSVVDGINYFNGVIQDSELQGTITLGGNAIAKFKNCSMNSFEDIPPVIDMGISGQDCMMVNYAGYLKFINFNSATNYIGVGLSGGDVIVDGTCVDGSIVINGIGTTTLIGNPTASVDDGALNKPCIADAVWTHDTSKHIQLAVWVDTELVSDGNGSQLTPFNNVNSAKDYAEANNIKDIYLAGDITIPTSIKNMNVHGIGLARINLNGQDVKGSKFYQCSLSGDYVNSIIAVECHLEDGISLAGHFLTCELVGTSLAKPNTEVLLASCMSDSSGSPATLSMNSGLASSVIFNGFDGELIVSNADDVGDVLVANMSSGKLTMDSSCTNGSLTARGGITFIDNSIGKIAIDETYDRHSIAETTMGYTR